ncbi:MAG TPA: mechanosensitive ion channel domain-containing protein [Candidatus Acidoferrales bacterium]|nr:mechanosensitive ion channel domain-containing protein [Candidatus Acidoferrales bacterium]
MIAKLVFASAVCVSLWGQQGGAPVIVDGKEVLRVYEGAGPFLVQERAEEIRRHIVLLAERGVTGEITTRRRPSEKVTTLLAGEITVMNLTDGDVAASGLSRDEYVGQSVAAIQKAIVEYRARHTWLSFSLAALKTIIAWSLFCGLVWVLMKGSRWLHDRIQQRLRRESEARHAQGLHLMIWQRGELLLILALRALVWVFLIFQFSFVVSYSFGLFPQTAGISTTLLDYLRATTLTLGKAVINYLPSGGVVIIVVLIARYLLKLLRFLATAIEHGELSLKGLHPEMAKPTYQLVRILVILFALIAVFPYLPGGQSEAFKGVSIFLGLLLSLGSSSAVSNVLAGLVLTYMRPFRVGDFVKIADSTGDVLEKNLLVTRLRTVKNVEVVIPNGAVLGNQILNYSAMARNRGLILNTTVTIGYDAPWRTVHELLNCAARGTDGILAEPAPFVLQTALNDFNVSYQLNAYTDRPNDMVDIYSRLHENIQDSFNRAGVEIMSPSYYALRDGNTVTIPENDRPRGYEAPSFRLRNGA